ncbi:MAG TPA: glutathione S-transferase family protein [Candidatus Dormibacteraeota bacterium]|nr:glutathione S-transferase family protein [Candidatus Dormibacteraeota bacterium]
MSLKLLHFEACPFCEKVRLSLRHMKLPYEAEVIEPGDRSRVEEVSGQRLVPVLCDGERVIPDSTRILRYLIARYGDTAILPGDPAEQALAWIVEDYADEVLGPLLRSILEDRTDSGAPLQGAERRELERHLETQFRNLEQLFSQRAHVFGNRPGLADISLYAFLVSLVRSGRSEISSGFPHLKLWYGRMESL